MKQKEMSKEEKEEEKGGAIVEMNCLCILLSCFLFSSTSIFKSIRSEYICIRRWTTDSFFCIISLVYVMKRMRIDINQALCPSSTVVSQW